MSTPALASLFRAAGSADGAVHAAPVPALHLALAQLRAVNHRFIGAADDPRGTVLDSLTHRDFLQLQADGTWRSRDEFLARMGEQQRSAGARFDAMRVQLFGRVALVHGVFVCGAPGTETTRIRATDVHLWHGSAWRLVSTQDTPLQDTAPLQQQHGTAPARAAWQGQDPRGDDFSVLHALNENYVKAFREADVAWYDAHLAPDYAVVSGDGSFQDRAAALAHFAEPTFATSMESFPVHKVNVRCFDDVALIHAENAYRLKDGREGVSRYTDIWHKRDGRWSCVAAHITVHKAPTKTIDSP
jgi:ketosteroid isomerase-like protein